MTSMFDTLTPAKVADAPLGFLAFERETLASEERSRADAEVIAAGGEITERMAWSGGLRPGRIFPRRQPVSYYLVPLEALGDE